MENLNFWVKKLDPYFEEIDETPLFRGESFSFENLSNALKKELNLPDFSLTSKFTGLNNLEEIKKIMGEKLSHLCLSFPPLMGNVYLLLGRDDISKLTSSILSKGEKNNFSSIVLEEGFFRFLVLFTLDQLKKTPTFKGLSAKVVEDVEIKSKAAYFLEINIQLRADCSIPAFIAITPDFRRSWNDFFYSKKSIILDKVKSGVDLPVQIIAGHTILTKDQWQSAEVGDFIVLDKSYIDPVSGSNKALLALNGNPLFLASIEKNKIEILEYASYQEESEFMEQKPNKILDPSIDPPEDIAQIENASDPENEDISLKNDAEPISEEISPLRDMPIKLTVEIAKVSISLEKLLELQPGNFLSLPISLEDPVNLTVNGKKIGTAEFTKIGDIFGIRILQIG